MINDKDLFESQALIYRNKITKIRSLLKRNPYQYSLSDYPLIFGNVSEAKKNKKFYDDYEDRLSQIIMHCNLAIQYFREAEKTRHKIITLQKDA